MAKVLVSRPDGQGLGLGLETWRPRSRSWSRDLKKILTTTLDLKSEMGATGFKYSWRKMEAAAQGRTWWRKVVCGLSCTGTDKHKSSQVSRNYRNLPKNYQCMNLAFQHVIHDLCILVQPRSSLLIVTTLTLTLYLAPNPTP